MIDSEKAYDKMISTIANKFGKEYTVDVRMKILGTPEPITAKLAVDEMQLPITPEEFLKEYREMGKTYLQNPPLFDGKSIIIFINFLTVMHYLCNFLLVLLF